MVQNHLSISVSLVDSPADLSFQLLHALHSLEKLLRNFLNRKAVFDIVFWECMFKSTPRNEDY